MAGRKPGGVKTGGRKQGTPNKATTAIKEAASEYSEEALETLASVMQDETQPAAARISAANAILDRAHGKPPQAITGDDEAPLALRVTALRRTIKDPKDMTDAEVDEEIKSRVGA